MSDATPRPWTRGRWVWDAYARREVPSIFAGGATVAQLHVAPITPFEEAEANAALIVRAVNAHEKLVEALKVVHARRIAWPAEVEALVVEALRAAEGDA